MAVDFTNSGDAIDFGSVTVDDNLTQKTIYVVFEMDGWGHDANAGILIANIDDANTKGWVFQVDQNIAATNGFRFVVWFSGSAAEWRSDNTLETGKKYFLAVTYDGSNITNDPIFYLAEIGSSMTTPTVTETTAPIGTVDDDSGTNLVIGNRNFAGAVYNVTFDGRVHVAGIANRVLDANTIRGMAEGLEIDGMIKGVVFHCPLIGATGLQVYDGATLTNGTNYIIDSIAGIQGDPVGNPVGYGDTVLAIRG